MPGSPAVTGASQRRMDERDHFVRLGDKPYIDLIDPETKLPVLTLTIEGRPQAKEHARMLLEMLGNAAELLWGLKLEQRMTA